MARETPWEPETPDEEVPQDPGIPGPRAPDELPDEEETAPPQEDEWDKAPPERGLVVPSDFDLA
jgi:hypothetical protein